MVSQPTMTRVLIVGAGPVGLTLAIDLAWRGIDVTVVEMRRAGEPPSVKCNHVAARSMEIFRRLGVARKSCATPACRRTIRTTSPSAPRSPARSSRASRFPCRRDRYTATGGPDTWWPTPEPPHRINQIYLEPILFAHAAAHAGRARSSTAPRSTTSRRTTTASPRPRATSTRGETVALRARYLVGCDGGRSAVRQRDRRASLPATPVVQRVQSTYIRAPDLLVAAARRAPAWGNVLAQPAPQRQRLSPSTAARPGWSTTT